MQNPLDPRAKSDTKLINLVVTFLSMLGHEAEQGGVHRMLGICAEFERIAKVVIERAEKEQSSRRKRKNQDAAAATASSKTGTAPSASSTTPRAPPTAASTPGSTGNKPASSGTLSPSQHNTERAGSYSPMHYSAQETSPSVASVGWPQEFPVPQNGDLDSFGFPSGVQSPHGRGSISAGGPFQQPLLPQDLFSLPMSLDWEWAEMSGGAYPTVENGNFGMPQQRR